MPETTLQERLLKLIEKKGVTRYDISRITGVAQSTFSHILNGHTQKLSRHTAQKLADYFKVNVDWLMYGHEESGPEQEKIESKSPLNTCNDPAHFELLKKISELEAKVRGYEIAIQIINDLRKGDPPEKHAQGDLAKSRGGKAV